MTVGDRIKELRLKLGLSQVDFADKINVSKQTLYKYENNIITNIPSDKIEAAAKLGNISPSYLMGWENVDWDLLQKQKESRKRFAYVYNIQYFEKQMLDSFSKLNDENKKRSIAYTKNLLSTQQMEDEVYEVAAAHDMNASSEQKKHADDIMKDPSEWE